MKKPQIDLQDDDFTCVLISALRYAIGRESYMPYLFTNYVRPLLPYLTDKALWLFERDIREQAKYGERAYGNPDIDKPTWDKFYNDVVVEQQRRLEYGHKVT